MSGKIKVVCLGDSITEGFGLSYDENYPYLLQKQLGDNYKVINAGVCAHCVTDEVLPNGRIVGLPYTHTEKYADGIAAKGDIYIILLGTNDAQDGMFDDGSAVDQGNNVFAWHGNFIKHYERILEDVRRENASAKIYIGRPTPVLSCIWPKHQQKYLDVILEKIDEIAARNPDVFVIDFFSEFQARGGEWLKAAYQQDGLHPGPDGARLIARLAGDRILKDCQSF